MIRALGPVLRNQKGPALKFKRTTVLDELSKRTSTHTPEKNILRTENRSCTVLPLPPPGPRGRRASVVGPSNPGHKEHEK